MLSPVFGVLLSAIVLGERLSLTLLASGLLIVAGAVLSYMRARPAA
jgi:drug/metabolite transporter (DMT)-like permease